MDNQLHFSLDSGTVDRRFPLIYQWEIRDKSGNLKGLYIGKAKAGGKRPLKHYKRNVNRLLAGKPYRASKPAGFRKSHVALAEAVRNGYDVTLRFVCNVAAGEDIDQVEQTLIKEFNCSGEAPWQLNQV